MEAPTIVKLEQEIEREMRIDAGEVESDYSDYEEPEPEPQKVAIDFKSLDEMVIMIFAEFARWGMREADFSWESVNSRRGNY